MPETRIDRLIDLLVAHRSTGTFNQYRDVHPGLDRVGAAAIRIENLRSYLERFTEARFLLVGEAAGYAGCRFSGIPFTSEALISGPDALHWAVPLGLRASSLQDYPWDEASARAVWHVLGERTDSLLWNAFPWHPFQPERPLSNRPPGKDVDAGAEALRWLLAAFPRAQPVAVGRVAQRALDKQGITAPFIRHPSHGGRRAFEAGLATLWNPTKGGH